MNHFRKYFKKKSEARNVDINNIDWFVVFLLIHSSRNVHNTEGSRRKKEKQLNHKVSI